MKPILVQLSAPPWTMQAVHLACALARSYQTSVVLLRLIPVTHPGYLGTTYGDLPPSPQEYDRLLEYAATAEDYQVEFSVQSMQYVTTLDAVVDAAASVDAAIVFAHVSHSLIPYWQRFQIWLLRRRLNAAQRQLFTLTEPVNPAVQVPFVVDTHRASTMS